MAPHTEEPLQSLLYVANAEANTAVWNSVWRQSSKECYGCLYTPDPLLPRFFLPDLVVLHDPTLRGQGQTTPTTTQSVGQP
ncbi:MAG: hypothetical protein JWN70_144 [Planctomycetaceae bacterium]|nr:hypothetical protein [Planctomycetaceae bacterium]